MKKLSYGTLEEIGYTGYVLKEAPEKVMQFGEGNFLRGFADYFIDVANEKADWNGKVVLVQPIGSGLSSMINDQEGLYTLYLRGSEKGRDVNEKRLISSVSRCLNPYEDEGFEAMMEYAESDSFQIVISNTTEAGIAFDPACMLEDRPASSFPGKLTQVLFRRWKAEKSPVVILSCELIDNNGKELKRCVDQYIELWKLPAEFAAWCDSCTFCSTLVDRIVPGRIRDAGEKAALDEENGYIDDLIDVGECFGVWIVEGPSWLADTLPFEAAGLNVHVVEDVTPYKKRKVRILNGAHTGFVLGAYLAGFDIVRDCMHDETIKGFMNKMLYDEVIPTLSLDRRDLEDFAAAVEDRFNNPYVDHQLMSISLNSTSKWNARNKPSLLEYVQKEKKLPACLTMSLAFCIAFYSSEVQARAEAGLVCRRPSGEDYTVCDDASVLDFYYEHREDGVDELVRSVLSNQMMWDEDLRDVPGLEEAVAAGLALIRAEGAMAAFESCLK